MKRIDHARRRRNARYARWGLECRQRQNRESGVGTLDQGVVSSRKPVNIKAPKQFNVSSLKRRGELLAFFAAVESALEHGATVRVDLSSATELYPCGTLMFMARLDAWVTQAPGRVLGTYPKDAVAGQLFQHIGVFDRIGLECRYEITHDRVRHWHFHSGHNVDASIYREMTVAIRDRIDHPERDLFADCLNEAVCNTVNHAYEFECEGMPPTEIRKWWMFSQVKDGSLFVAIYDFGVSIPRSLLRKPEWKDYVRLHKRDAILIEAAAASPRTRTKLSHRGKGLPEMLEFSQKLAGGEFSILSRKGAFSYNSATKSQRRWKFTLGIQGTLVQWRIPFREPPNGS